MLSSNISYDAGFSTTSVHRAPTYTFRPHYTRIDTYEATFSLSHTQISSAGVVCSYSTISMVILITISEKLRFLPKEALEYILEQVWQNFPDIEAIKEDSFIPQDPVDDVLK
ncbi:uncharacterized protein BDCG_00016 [Blastomyces dermatitidis ER-3]|nr:uncharacterized protein BDCG_00016 [Blastomyces dermatitidis ER-3]EEQ83211.2 hypothetical protein BDCG_00016 [Blastomyces dermatitidis ER-3]